MSFYEWLPWAGLIAFIMVFLLIRTINRQAEEIERIKAVLRRGYGIDIDGYNPEDHI